MDDRPSGGGAANTPPFPRLVRNESDQRPNGESSRPPTPAGDTDAAPEIRALHDSTRRPENPGHSRDRAEPAGPARRPLSARARHDLRRRAEIGLHRGFERIADRLEDAAERLEFVAEERLAGPGPRARASDLAFSAAGWIGEVSDYLRASEIDTLRADLERQVRERPVQTLLLAAGAGWLLGKILR